MANFIIDNKIFGIRNFTNEKTYEDCMYPSLSKLLNKKLPLLNSFFEYHLEPLSFENLEKIFIPIYKQYVVSKKDYILNENEVYFKLKKNIIEETGRNYYLIWITKIDDPSVIYGATVFNIALRTNIKTCSFVHKGYDHKITKELKIGISLDVWTESIIQNFALANNCKQLRHGRDLHFRKKPGLHLFKLKTGTMPLSGIYNKEIDLNRSGLEQITITDEDIQKNNLSVFFTTPNSEGFFTELHLFYKVASNDKNMCEEFQTIGEKVGLKVILTEY